MHPAIARPLVYFQATVAQMGVMGFENCQFVAIEARDFSFFQRVSGKLIHHQIISNSILK